jgi:hypothetical protein
MRTAAPIAVAVLLVLAGCGAETAPTATPTAEETDARTPTPTPTPQAEETPAPDRPDRIAIDTTVLIIGGPADDEVEVFDYFRPVDAAVDALTAAFGSDPTIGYGERTDETAAFISYRWGGLTLYDTEGAGRAPAHPDFSVVVTAPSVAGIPVFTHVAIQVGTPMREVIEVQDGFLDDAPDAYVSWIFSQPIDPVEVGQASGADLRIFVSVWGPPGGTGAVEEIRAPSVNFEL